jgi:hypothetical protein
MAALRAVLGPSPFDDAGFRVLSGAPVAVRGDQPSEILPGLFLSGHPARFTKKGGGFPSHPAGYVHEKTKAALILNCCAPPAAASFVVEDLSSGGKKIVDNCEECVSHGSADAPPSMALHNIAMVDEDTYPIAQDLAPACQSLALVLVPQWRRLIQQAANGAGAESEAESVVRGALVHCQMGVSRSATVVVAFLMWAFDMSLDTALAFAESRRSCVSPNPGFLAVLRASNAQPA